MGINKKVIKKLNVQAAESFIDDITEDSTYYIFAAKHTAFGNTSGPIDMGGGTDESPPTPADTTKSAIQVYNDMLFGKKVKTTDTALMIKNYAWKSGNVYDMYKDYDSNLADKQFYCVTDDVVEYNVYKCLYNNGGAASLDKPSGQYTTPHESPVDGYIWKYMFTIDQLSIRKFATSDYVPVVAREDVAAAAVPGSIEIIEINNGGAGYTNYTRGRFPSDDSIKISGNVLQYGLDAGASSTDTFYNNCLIKITSGAATGQYRLISSYTLVNGKKVIEIDHPFDPIPTKDDEYEIYPNVFVYDVNGTHTANCVAWAVVNSAMGNAVSRIEVLDPGAGYRLASAKIKSPPTVIPLANAVVTPILSPPGGHGANFNNELFAHYVGLTTSFVGDSEPLSANNDYRTVGLLKNPLYANVSITLDTPITRGTFLKGENVYRYKPVRVFGNVAITANTLVIGSNTSFLDSFRSNDRVIITNGVTNLVANVESITSDTEMVIDKLPAFEDANCSIFSVQADHFGVVADFNPYALTLTDVNPVGSTISSFMFGDTSYATTKVANTQPYMTINGRDADEFNAFNQLTLFVGAFNTDMPMVEDEAVVQELGDEDTNPTAIIHSFRDNPGSANDYLYVTNITNNFQTTADDGDGLMRGLQSNAYFTARHKYDGEIISDSGEILYLENVSPIARNYKQTETIKLILEF